MEKIKQLQQDFADFMAQTDFGGQPTELYDPIAYTILQSGKRLRPMLCLLANDMFGGDEQQITFKSEGGIFLRFLNSLLDGGKDGVSIGLAIIPGVLCISTIVMMLTFGHPEGGYTGAAYEGVPVITWAANKINVIFDWLFGFKYGALISFPMTALGAVGAAIGLVPRFISEGIIDSNAIAVFTAIGMCWSGFLSTHAAMLDSLGYRKLIGKAITAHAIGGLCAGIAAHWLYVLLHWIVSLA